MLSTTIFPGRYVQGYDALKNLGEEIKRFGGKGMILTDPWVIDNLLPNFENSMKGVVDYQVERFGGEISDEEIDRLVDLGKQSGSDVVVGIGGGKTLDTAKAVAHYMKVPVIVAPTIASTDAPTSALSVIYTAEGEFKRYLILPKNPDVVVVDSHVVANAPVRFLVSGMGDALATWFEAESVRQSYAANMTGNVGSMTAHTLARLCYETLIRDGLEAKTACEVHAVTPALERVIEANTLLSGLGFESGGLAASHAIHNGLTVLEETHAYYHGEKVAMGTLASLFLTGKSSLQIDEVYTFCENVGLPTTLAEIGLENVTDEKLMEVANAATAEGETIHNEPMPVTARMVMDALKAADAEGKRRLGFLEEASLIPAD